MEKGEAREITQLQFVDDAILFCEAEEEQLRNIKVILLCFEAVSSLRVNFFKSELIGIRVDESHLQNLTDLIGYKAGALPSTYLGLPLCYGAASKSLWMPVLERLEKKTLFVEN
eukprot:TRINITY_DN48445_c0_g1_i1.p1 TRINITY_DN48445_c0_g1~~TRINITY_DN48445_c0_g1_i1.p1  ORF type:complete len:114 (-),score=18.34 TRINITY_DN48445_c0_g1_i1:96-437(-)